MDTVVPEHELATQEDAGSTSNGELFDPAMTRFLGQQFWQLSRILSADSSQCIDPERLIRFTVACVPHATHGGLTLIRRHDGPKTLATTNELPVALDELQSLVGQGPGLDAAEGEGGWWCPT